MNNKWTEEELEFLRKNYPSKNKGARFVAEKLGRAYTAVLTMAVKHKIRSKKRTTWEPWQIDYLKEFYGLIPMEVIQKRLKKTYSAILEKAQIYKLSKPQSPPFNDYELKLLQKVYIDKCYKRKDLEKLFDRKYDHIRKIANSIGLYREYQISKNEINFLKRNYKKLTRREMAEKLGISEGIVKWQLKKFGLKKEKTKSWTKEDLDFLKKYYKKLSNKEIAESLGRTEKSIIHMTRKTSLNTNKKNLWSKEEIDFLVKNYNVLSKKELSKELKRSPGAIYNKWITLFPD